MSNFNCMFRCPCCNEELSDWETSMYDVFGGMTEECYNTVMQAAYEGMDETILVNEDLDKYE